MAREVNTIRKRSARLSTRVQAEMPSDAGGPPRIAAFDADRRRALIAEAAYYRSLRRVASGSEIDDWLDAEQEVDATLMAPASR